MDTLRRSARFMGFRQMRLFSRMGGAWGVLALCCACARSNLEAQAALLVDAGRTKEAVQVLQQHLLEQPDDPAARRQLIRVLGYEGDLAAAEQQAALLAQQLGPEDPVPWLELGHAYELAHRYEEALAFYDRATQVAPRDPRGPRTGGQRAARWGELEWAAPRLEEALRRNPQDSSTWHALALVRVHQGRYMEARVAYLRGLRIEPGNPENRVGLATLALRMNRPAEALAHYDALAAQRPGDGNAQLGRAYALWRLGRYEEGLAAVRHARKLGADEAVSGKLEQVLAKEEVRVPATSDEKVIPPPPGL